MSSKKDSQNFYDIGCQAKDLFLYDVAIKYLTKAAELGNAEAMYLLSNIYAGNDETYYHYGHLKKENERIVSNDDEQIFLNSRRYPLTRRHITYATPFFVSVNPNSRAMSSALSQATLFLSTKPRTP